MAEIRELIKLLDESSLAELTLETEDMKFYLKKASEPAPTAVAPMYLPSMSAGSSVIPDASMLHASHQNVPAAPTQSAASASPDADASLHILTSPMVGTFYRSPAPDSPAYIELGSRVSEKTVVCIIEAMKLMNEIESEVNGEVVEVLVENGQLVEYGQPLFRIRRS